MSGWRCAPEPPTLPGSHPEPQPEPEPIVRQAQEDGAEGVAQPDLEENGDESISEATQRLTSLKTTLVEKTKRWNIDRFEEVHARITRTIEPYYASILSLGVLLDQLESVVNQATLS